MPDQHWTGPCESNNWIKKQTGCVCLPRLCGNIPTWRAPCLTGRLRGRVIKTAENIIGAHLQSISDIDEVPTRDPKDSKLQTPTPSQPARPAAGEASLLPCITGIKAAAPPSLLLLITLSSHSACRKEVFHFVILWFVSKSYLTSNCKRALTVLQLGPEKLFTVLSFYIYYQRVCFRCRGTRTMSSKERKADQGV